jgi:cold shock CspA family protein
MKSREHGAISTFNGSYAFITPDSGEKDIFAHSSQLPDNPIHRGDRVSFDLAPDKFKPGKMCANNVRMEGDSAERGMYGVAEETSNGALAAGLQKLLRDTKCN